MAPWSRTLGVIVLVGLASAVVAVVAWPASPVYPAPLENGSTIADAHAAELESADSFTYRDTTRIRVNGTLETNRSTVARFDTDTGAELVERHSDRAGRYTVYGDGAGSSYERHAPPAGAVRYGQPLSGAARVSQYRNPGIAPLLGDVEYTYQGTTRLDGVRVHEYAATTPEQIGGVVGEDTDPDVDTTVNVRVFISTDGVVRRMRILVDQRDGTRTRTLNSTLAYTAVGETSVPEPGWLETARNRTGPSR
ncbi:MAG: hypothetical protein V5A39_13650 [Haloarculaceae archaeon]